MIDFSILNYVRCPVCEGNAADPNHPRHPIDPASIVLPDFNAPRVIKETVEWVVVGAGKICNKCKHLHYPRVPQPNDRNSAPMWFYCEGLDCTCHTLHK